MQRFDLNRRSVLGGALAMAGSAAMAAPQPFFKRTGLPLGLQLYTLGDLPLKDLDGSLAAVSAAGYQTVELASYLNKTPAELRAALDRAKLKCTSAHIAGRALRPGPSLQDDLGALARDAHVLGFDRMVMPLFYIPERLTLAPQPGEDLGAMLGRLAAAMTVDDWKFNADFLNKKGAALKREGIRLGYHNHNPEFAPLAGTTAMDILLKETDPALVEFEMDAGWVVAAGKDPFALLAAHPKRFTAMHVKDIKKTTKPNFILQQDPVEVGGGFIDWKRLLPAAQKAGVVRFFVEQEPPFARDRLEAVKISATYLNGLAA